MKGAFSRLIRAGGPERFSNVLLQQGRVLLDADWNDLAQIIERELRERTRMIIGPAGGPEHDAGFFVRPHCGIRLNYGEQYGQWIVVEVKNLSFAAAYTLALEFRLPPKGCATESRAQLIDVDRRWQVISKSDNCLELVVDGRSTPLGEVEADRSWLLVARESPERGLELWLHPADEPSEVPVAGPLPIRERRGGDTVWIAGGPDEREDLCCTIEGLWIWAKRAEQLPRVAEGRLILHDCELRCDLDTCDVETIIDPLRPGARIDDRSGHESYGWIRTVNDHEQLPPVVLLDAFATSGSYFVEGVLADNREAVEIPLPCSAGRDESLWLQFNLEVWERFITALQDSRLLEPALGGPDTTARTETVWQVEVLCERRSAKELDRRIEALRWRRSHPGQARFVREQDGSFDAGNRLYRAEIHHPGWAWSEALPRESASKAWVRASKGPVKQKQVEIEEPDIAALLRPDSPVALWSGCDGAPMIARVVCKHDDSFVLDMLPQDPRELRVLPLASYKWSRDNGSVAFPVAEVVEIPSESKPADVTPSTASASSSAADEIGPRVTITLAGPGYNGLDLEPGQWLELLDDELELERRGGYFFRIVSVDFSSSLQLTAVYVGAATLPLTRPSEGQSAELILGTHPIVRRWDVGPDQGESDHGLPAPLRIVRADRPEQDLLEQGIELEFAAAGFFGSGDWWVAAVRDAVDEGLLPPAEQLRPPQGIAIHVAELARIELGLGYASYRDQRKIFAPLAKELPRPDDGEGEPDSSDERRSGDTSSSTADSSSIQSWIAGARILVAEGEEPEGFVATGEQVIAQVEVEQAEWTRVAHRDGDPSGAGEALSWEGRPVFLNKDAAYEHGEGGWRKLPPLPEQLEQSTDFAATSFGSLLWVLGNGARNGQPMLVWLAAGATAWRQVQIDALADYPSLMATSVGLASLGSSIHVVGGRLRSDASKSSGYLARHLEINPRSGTVSEHQGLNVARTDFALVAHDGQLYALGGCNESGNLASVERWHPEVDQWIELQAQDPPPGMSLHAAASIEEGIVVSGGDSGSGRSPAAWLFDPGPGSSRWRKLQAMNTPRFRHGLVPVGRELWAVAGDSTPSSEHLILTRKLRVMRVEPNK